MSVENYLRQLLSEITESYSIKESLLDVLANKAYISVLYSGRLICTVHESQRSLYCSFSSDDEDLFDGFPVSYVPSDPRHIKVSLTCVEDLDLIRDQIGTIISGVTTGSTFDICSRYMECSEAKRCVQTADYAAYCSYGHKLKRGIVFFGPNRNADILLRDKRLPASKAWKSKTPKGISSIPVDYVVVDTETSGLDPARNSIIEISAIRCRNGAEVDRFSSLVRPPKQKNGSFVSPTITNLTGITNEMLTDAPGPENVFPQVFDFIKDDIIVGHNVSFDIRFINAAFEKYGNGPLRNEVFDTLKLSRCLLPNLQHHRLCDIALALGVESTGAHRSLADCETTQACLCKLAELAAKT